MTIENTKEMVKTIRNSSCVWVTVNGRNCEHLIKTSKVVAIDMVKKAEYEGENDLCLIYWDDDNTCKICSVQPMVNDVCDKYSLEYTTGMGTFCFWRIKDTRPIYKSDLQCPDHWENNPFQDLIDVLNLLGESFRTYGGRMEYFESTVDYSPEA